jgi:hypothetical protein
MTDYRSRPRLVLNLVATQGLWFLGVWAGSRGLDALAVGGVALWVAAHLTWLVADRRREALFIAAAVLLGLVQDTLLLHLGRLHYPASPAATHSPLFMLALWANLATVFPTCLHWLQGRYALAAVLGGVGGGLAYASGARLGAIELAPGLAGPAAVALAYALSTPLLLRLRLTLHRSPRCLGVLPAC